MEVWKVGGLEAWSRTRQPSAADPTSISRYLPETQPPSLRQDAIAPGHVGANAGHLRALPRRVPRLLWGDGQSTEARRRRGIFTAKTQGCAGGLAGSAGRSAGIRPLTAPYRPRLPRKWKFGRLEVWRLGRARANHQPPTQRASAATSPRLSRRVSAKTRLRRDTSALTPGTFVPSRAECPGFQGDSTCPCGAKAAGGRAKQGGAYRPRRFRPALARRPSRILASSRQRLSRPTIHRGLAATSPRLSRRSTESQPLSLPASAANPPRLSFRSFPSFRSFKFFRARWALGEVVVRTVPSPAACFQARPSAVPGGAGCLAPCRGSWGRRPHPPKAPSPPSPNPPHLLLPSAAEPSSVSGQLPERWPPPHLASAAKSPRTGG